MSRSDRQVPGMSGLRPGTGVRMPVAQRKHWRTGALLPASRVGELLTGFAVHNHVDHLCKTAPDLCAYWEMLGIPLPGRACNKALVWENAVHALWMGKKTELSTRHAVIAHK